MNDKKQFIKDMTEFKALHDEMEVELIKLSRVGFDLIEAPISHKIEKAESLIQQYICRRYEIELEVLEWFIYENNWGENGYECSQNGSRAKKIKTFSDFWNFEKGK
jgi:uncharacterized protein Usg